MDKPSDPVAHPAVHPEVHPEVHPLAGDFEYFTARFSGKPFFVKLLSNAWDDFLQQRMDQKEEKRFAGLLKKTRLLHMQTFLTCRKSKPLKKGALNELNG